MEWVKKIIMPYIKNVPRGIILILLIDYFLVHKTGPVVTAIQALGVEVEFIPPSCTEMVQLVDIGYNKPLKSRFHDQYHEWTYQQDLDVQIPCPSRRLVAT